MKWRSLRAGERRKLARNMEFNREARTIGVVGFSFVTRMLLPILAVFGLAAVAYATQTGHVSGHAVLAMTTPALVSPGTDFLEVIQESENMNNSNKLRSRQIKNFDEKLIGFIELINNKAGLRAHQREFLMREAETTSDFPILFGTVLERQLAARYAIQTSDWRTYVKTGTQKDFRSNNIIGVFGLESELSVVAERGEYKSDNMDAGKVANSLKKYGRQFSLSWETLINDDLGAFADTASRLANAALATEYMNATRLFVSPTVPNASLFGTALQHPIDKATVNNLIHGQLAIDTLETVIVAMQSQVDTNNNPIVVERFHLVVPPALQFTALKILSQSALIATGVGNAAAVRTSENIIAKLPITLHVNPYIPLVATDATLKAKSWYVFAEGGGEHPAIQMNFLRGHEAPEIVQKSSNKLALGGGLMSQMEGDFESDSAAWRVRHVLGGTQVDPRFAFASDGTA
jgi:hypothetical protein